MILIRIVVFALAFGVGYAFVSPALKPLRLIFGGLVVLVYVLLVPLNPLDALAAFAIFLAAIFMFGDKAAAPTTFGSSRWAAENDVRALGLVNDRGFWLGSFLPETKYASPVTLRYGGDRHLLTCAPTRSGKGVSAIIPTLLTYQGSALVIDPKAENAIRTAEQRRKMGQVVHLLDPWGLTREHLTDIPVARFNPLDWITADSPDAVDNAMLLADAMVMKTTGAEEPFWDEEAKSLLAGLILYVATDPKEAQARHLGRMRDILALPNSELDVVLKHMGQSKTPLIASTGARTLSKEEKIRSSVLTTAQSHTHWLENPAIRENLAGSDVDFGRLKSGRETVYLILPADRLSTYARWLRILVQQAITVNARNIAEKPDKAVLFMLDEMAALGPLTAVQTAFGLMAGYGMQLWGIVQDLGQLKRLYGDGWETFISNAGVFQYFGSRDVLTAEYVAKLCGKTTVKSFSIANIIGGQGSTTQTSSEAQRDLAYADELMTLRDGAQIVFVETSYPIRGVRTPWYVEPTLKALGRRLATDPAAGTASRALPEFAPPTASQTDQPEDTEHPLMKQARAFVTNRPKSGSGS